MGGTERSQMGSSSRLARLRALLVAFALLIALVGGQAGTLAAESARVVRRADTTDRVVALTFDDGWHAGRCERIFDILLEHEVPATWFPNAVYAGGAPGLWRRIAEHHPIANHTTHHHALPRLSAARMRREIASDERRLEALTGRPMSRLLRPPYGAHDRRVRRVVAELGYETLVLWDVDSTDTRPRATERAVTRAASRGGPGSIVLMHCGPAVTPRVLPAVIARYACDGYRFATVEELLAGEPGVSARVACPPGAELTEREWRLSEVDVDGTLMPTDTDALLTLRFGPRMATGMAGCGAYAVRVSLGASGSLTFGRLRRDRAACMDAESGPSIAASWLDVLVGSSDLRVVDDRLELLDTEARVRLRFRASPPMHLTGGWTATSIVDADGDLIATGAASPLSVTFGSSGSLRGWSGCDTFAGGYGVRGDVITIGPLLDGSEACGDGADTLEARFLAALRSAVRWAIVDGVLRFRDAKERVVLELDPMLPEG